MRSTLLLLIILFHSIQSFSQQPTLVIQQGHKSKILFDDINKEEAAWLTVDENEAFLWNITSGRQLRRISLPSRIRGGSFINKGKEIVLGAYDYNKESTLYFYNALNGEKSGSLEFHDSTHPAISRRKNWKPIDQLLRNPDGSKIAIRSFDRFLYVDVLTRKFIGEYKLPSYNVQTGLLSNDQFVVANQDAEIIKLVKLDFSGNELKDLIIDRNTKPVFLEVHPNLPLIALACKDGSIYLIDDELEIKKK